MKKLIAFALILVLIITMSVSVSAAEYGCNVVTSSNAVYLENLDSGIVVFEKSADEKMPPASLTKMMTYIVVCENVEDLVNTKITVTEEALADLDPASSVMGLASYIGQEFSVLDLLYGLMLPSGNDAALVLAGYVGDGVVDNFVDLMNRKAGQLGCSATHFVNPHGLYDSMHYSTARDLAVIAKYAFEQPYFTDITSKTEFQVRGMNEPLETTNYMIDPSYPEYYYEYATGIKTGYTDEAGKCLASTASKDNYNYLCIALGAPYSYAEDINYAMLDSKELYTWAFENISNVELLNDGSVIKNFSVKYVWGDRKVDAVSDGAVAALLPKNYDKSLVTTQVDLPTHATAPVEKGEVFGTISVYYDGELVGTTNVVSAETIKRDNLNYLAHRVVGFISNNALWLVIILAIVIAFVVLKINADRQRKRRKARHRYR